MTTASCCKYIHKFLTRCTWTGHSSSCMLLMSGSKQSRIVSTTFVLTRSVSVVTSTGPCGISWKRVILPSSVRGSPRAMIQDYQDAMAIMANYGKSDYFVTFTCNPKWEEIEENLLLDHLFYNDQTAMRSPQSKFSLHDQCSKKFLKEYREQTSVEINSYPHYHQRNDPRYVEYSSDSFENRSIGRYIKCRLLLFNVDMNVEVCALIEAFKYLYKYMCKGPNRVSLLLQHQSNSENDNDQMIDEIKTHLDARYICALEGIHHLLGFPAEKKSDIAYRFAFHLPDYQNITFQLGAE